MTNADRLRPHPKTRSGGPCQVIDLPTALQKLRAEDHPAEQGHHQITLSHRSPVSQVLFAFEANGELPDHAANGIVTIQTIEGHLTVSADGEDYDLPLNNILVLDPGIPHSVRATTASAMLLTVHLNDRAAAARSEA